MARSIGSSPSATLASAAARSSGASASGSASPGRRSQVSPATDIAPTTSIWLQVSVPVLSTHSTVVEPKVSMAWGWRVRTCCRARRQAPSASITVHTTANSSGTMDMASVRPTSRPADQEPSRQAKSIAATTQVMSATMATACTRRLSSACSRLWRGATAPIAPPMRPSAVRGPVAVTSATPSPCTTSVPAFSRLASASPGCLSTGTDSPVSIDSSTRRPCDWRSTASQARRSPSSTSSRSPTTISWLEMRRTTPPRNTLLRGLARSCSASSTRWVRSSWKAEMPITAQIDTPSATASKTSPSSP